MIKISAVAALAVMALAAPVSAASLLTSSAGYTGPTLILPGAGYVFTAGPFALAGGITFTSETSSSVIGTGGYGLSSNGVTISTPIIGTNDGFSTITLTFDNAVASFGGGFNYAPRDGNNPTIAAFDEDGNLIASYDLSVLAPISTPAATDAFMFRGIDGEGTMIKSFTLAGSYIVMAGSTGAVPEPASWAMMIAGFGLVGAAMRRRSAAVTA